MLAYIRGGVNMYANRKPRRHLHAVNGILYLINAERRSAQAPLMQPKAVSSPLYLQIRITGGFTMLKYIAFIGLNDQTTKAQEVSTLDAFKVVSNLACKHIGYGTITEARGVYTHDDGTIIEEVTLRCEFSGATLEAVKAFCAAAKSALNQESIGLETVNTNFDFV